MTDPLPAYLVWLILPALFVWAITLADILSRPGLHGLLRLGWAVAVTIVFPTALAWYLIRPIATPAPHPLHQPDSPNPQQQLVTAVLARTTGTIDDTTYTQTLERILTPPPITSD